MRIFIENDRFIPVGIFFFWFHGDIYMESILWIQGKITIMDDGKEANNRMMKMKLI